jgi:hypothetical protein
VQKDRFWEVSGAAEESCTGHIFKVVETSEMWQLLFLFKAFSNV